MESYGLQLTNNSKAGPSFSLPRITCINKTEVCWSVCYGHGIRYQSESQKEKRMRNYRTCVYLLGKGGPELLAENLIALIDQCRPTDWLTAKIAGKPTSIPWTLRIHDIGDAFSVPYVQAWTIAVRSRPKCSFWFYTRSFYEPKLFAALTELADLANCQGWLSLDQDNYCRGILAYASKPRIWKLALLQEEPQKMSTDIIKHLSETTNPGDLIVFPQHRGGRHVHEIQAPNFVICPQVLGAFALEPSPAHMRPCQACNFCLPQ